MSRANPTRHRSIFHVTPPRNIRTILFLAFSALLLGLFIITNVLIGRLAQQAERTSRVFARFAASASFPAVEDTVYQAFVADVIQSINFPIVLSDVEGVPRAWKGVGVDPIEVPDRSLDSLAAGLEPSAVILERILKVRRAAERMDRGHEPIPLLEQGTDREIGLVHWGEPPILSVLRFLPYLSVGIFGILLLLTFWGARGIRLAEARSIWVGLAKETAHQLGTPLSSLLGWVELLREKGAATKPGETVQLDPAFVRETVTEMEQDVARLNKVAARFSQIGSIPALAVLDLTTVVRGSLDYVRRRLPHLGRSVRIEEDYQIVPRVRANAELLEWVMENLLVNALNALEGSEGRIEVRVRSSHDSDMVEVEVRDNGRGMTPEVQRRAFETGFSTKKRGWGLGLALAKRIVEDYHDGRISVRETAPGQGSAFVVAIPVASE
jgi:NtrC-family two-component system sensor histidine kinase KinB